MARLRGLVVSVVVLSSLCTAQVTLQDIWNKTSSRSNSNLPADRISAGLKEALRVSTGNAVAQTGRPDGFLKNEAIKILLPPKMQKASRTLRLIGMGPQLDELEIGMNRAAEQAAPQAKQIFLNALMQMSINDARQIFTGGDTAATEYFRSRSSEELATAFTPIVHRSLQNVGVVKQYNVLAQNPIAGAVFRQQNFDLDRYVVEKALDGLFYTVGQEERKIRTNPAARTTTLLKEIFGRR